MYCPYCGKPLTSVTNSRPTKENTQIWRRRLCGGCNAVFTTHEMVDLSHLIVIKKSGKSEMFSRYKLFSGIYGATIGSKIINREYLVEKMTREAEKEILALKEKHIPSQKIADIVLNILRHENPSVFLRFLAYNKNPKTDKQVLKEIHKYI